MSDRRKSVTRFRILAALNLQRSKGEQSWDDFPEPFGTLFIPPVYPGDVELPCDSLWLPGHGLFAPLGFSRPSIQPNVL